MTWFTALVYNMKSGLNCMFITYKPVYLNRIQIERRCNLNNEQKLNGFIESIIWQIYIHILSLCYIFLVQGCCSEHMTRIHKGYLLFFINGEHPYFFLHCTFSEGFTLHQHHANAAMAAAEHVRENTISRTRRASKQGPQTALK